MTKYHSSFHYLKDKLENADKKIEKLEKSKSELKTKQSKVYSKFARASMKEFGEVKDIDYYIP